MNIEFNYVVIGGRKAISVFYYYYWWIILSVLSISSFLTRFCHLLSEVRNRNTKIYSRAYLVLGFIRNVRSQSIYSCLTEWKILTLHWQPTSYLVVK